MRLRTIVYLLLGAIGIGIFGMNWLNAANEQDSNFEGIEFNHAAWDDLLAQAKTENKPIFVDVYATWCGPCKYMNRMVFTKKKVGDYFNENYICAKIDAEKGEGRSIARKFRITAYPTLLFIDKNGHVINREEGARNARQLIKLAKKSADQMND